MYLKANISCQTLTNSLTFLTFSLVLLASEHLQFLAVKLMGLTIMHDSASASASASCKVVPLVLLESGALGSKRPTNPRQTPRGRRVKSHTERLPIYTVPKQLIQEMASLATLRCRRFNLRSTVMCVCYVTYYSSTWLQLVPPQLLSLPMMQDSCVTTFIFHFSFQNYGAWHSSLSRSFSILYTSPPLRNPKFFMPFTSFGRPARRLASRINLTWLQFSQS